MSKKIIKILTIDKKTNSISSLVLFDIATEKKCDLIVFHPNEKKNCLEIILINYNKISHNYFEEKFQITIKKDDEGYFSNFEIPKITKEEFYQTLNEDFEIEVDFLSQF